MHKYRHNHWASQLLLSSSWEESGGCPNYPFSGEDSARVSKPNQTNKETIILNAASGTKKQSTNMPSK